MLAPGPLEIIILLVIPLIVILPFWKIFAKAGYNGALSLLMIVPLVNLILLHCCQLKQIAL